ncbi:hypothetical protein BGX28_004365 [Mortierella sp. GBA30]|nr:hypothetical protein BGX28_004365 [Mortierella sp. GBA30]
MTFHGHGSSSGSKHLWDKWRRIEVMINGVHEEETHKADGDETTEPSKTQCNEEACGDAHDVESWDDAFDLNSYQPFEHILEQLRSTFPRSPLSDISDQSDYFQSASVSTVAGSTPVVAPLPSFEVSNSRPSSFAYTHALPSPPTTTTATTLTSSRGTQGILTFGGGSSSGSDGSGIIDGSHSNIRRLVGSTEALLRVDTYSYATATRNGNSGTTNNKTSTSTLPPLALPPQMRDGRSSRYLGVPQSSSTTSSPASSASSSPRAITASVTAPSTSATSTRSLLDINADSGTKNKGKAKAQAKSSTEDEDFNSALLTTTMTTITQEMMLSNLPAYTGIITRINPIKRVAAWVDDLEDLEVPEEDLDFNQVRSMLAKSSSMPDTLESVETWDTDSEKSIRRDELVLADLGVSKCHLHPTTSASVTLTSHDTSILPAPAHICISMEKAEARKGSIPASEMIETLDDDFDLPEDLRSLHLCRQPRHPQDHSDNGGLSRKQSSLLRWQDLGSDMDDFDFESRSLSSSSLSRDSVTEEDLLDGIVFPELMESLKLVTDRPYCLEKEPSVFEKDSKLQDDDPEDFWEGLEIGDNSFSLKGRNKHLFVRPAPMGRERSGSRVYREVVPLKDFVALPSRIPRLCRAPGDTSRPVTPAPSLSRMHSTHFDLPLRNLQSKSSLPRLKRSSISRRDGVRTKQALSPMDAGGKAVSSEIGDSVVSTPFASRAPTPTAMQTPNSKRNSLVFNKDDLPSFRSSPLVMRSVSFTEPVEHVKVGETTEMTTVLPSIPQLPQTTSSAQGGGRAFPTLRMLVRKLDLGRPRLSARGPMPPATATGYELHTAAVVERNPSVPPLASAPYGSKLESSGDAKPAFKMPPNSRSSSFTDWASMFNTTETMKENRPASRVGPVTLGDISEVSTIGLNGEAIIGSPGQVVTTEKFSRRLFLKRSPKQSMFGDGSELDRFDNLPTFVQPTTESEVPTSSMIRKTKSIRKSLFDIFGQVTQVSQPASTAPVAQKPADSAKGRKRRSSGGPTLIRDLSQHSRVRKVSGMVYNPKDKMWDGNDDILDDFEDEDAEVATAMSAYTSPATSPRHFDFTGSPLSHICFPSSPLLGTPGTTAVNRPALITNMNQHSKQRMQVAGKMVFDPTKMCWVLNPEYLTKRRQQRRRHGHGHGDRLRQCSMDEVWGDEPDVFAGLSDSDKSQDDDQFGDEEKREDDDWNRVGTTGINSQSRSSGRRLLSRSSFQQQASHDSMAEHERFQSWPQTIVVPGSPHDSAEPRIAGIPDGFHSIVPKSSRKSLNGHHGMCSGGIGVGGGGGYSSRGEFEVGVEFDTTDLFLEQCIAAEAQHRREAGRFFALPCSPISVLELPAAVATTGRLSRMTTSTVLSLGKKSGKAVTKSKEACKEKRQVKELGNKEAEDQDSSLRGRQQKAKEIRQDFQANPLLSWPLRGKNKTRSQSIRTVLQSDISVQIEQDASKLRMSTLGGRSDHTTISERQNSGGTGPLLSGDDGGHRKNGNHSQSQNQNKDKNKSLGKSFSRSSLLLFVSNSSSSRRNSSDAPAAATLAARGRGNSREPSFHHPSPFARHRDDKRPNLSFAATLAVAHRGSSMSHDRCRIGADTFDSVDVSQPVQRQPALTARKDRGEGADDIMERGYRIMPSSRGRPPLRSRAELLLEFERRGQRYR